MKGIDQSVYEEESCKPSEVQEKSANIEKVIRFLWNGNTLLHEWEEENPDNRMKPKSKVDYKADYHLKLEKQEEEKAGKEAGRGQSPLDSLVTWVFQDDFIPRGKITKDGNYSIISDYLGTPVEAYDGEGKKVWERELDIYGRVKTGRKDVHGRVEKEVGDKSFIPFRYQGQYEDEETGLYYNRFRYYSLEDGCYTQQDPIGLAGNNPTLYGYVHDTNCWIDPFGLVKVVHFPDFDAALKKAFELATGGDPTITFTATKYDVLTGTEVEFIGTNKSKIAYDSPHLDMDPKLGHDKPHIGVNTGGKRKAGGSERYNLTYDGEQHPYRPEEKGKGNIPCN